MPCANDAEFIEKLKCLCERHVRIFGPLSGDENEPIIIAIAIHMGVALETNKVRRLADFCRSEIWGTA
jgi:hypothetical protein